MADTTDTAHFTNSGDKAVDNISDRVVVESGLSLDTAAEYAVFLGALRNP